MSKQYSAMNKTWDCKEVDWSEYESHRPPYTKALYDLIFQYHKEHGGQMESALDVGAGGGIITQVLLENFSHVIWSDQSTEYLGRAQQRFQNKTDAGSITFLQRKFNEFNPEQDFPNGQLMDMVTAGTCIHFGDPAQIMTQLGHLIRPGGTLAAFSYGSIPIISSDERIGTLARTCQEKIVLWIHENVAALANHDGPGTCQARYNNVDFDSAIWKNIRRITSLPKDLSWPELVQPAASRVRETESCEIVSDDFITKEVDYEFFPKYYHNFAPQLPVLEQIKKELEELKVAIGDGKVTARWPVMLVLATKR